MKLDSWVIGAVRNLQMLHRPVGLDAGDGFKRQQNPYPMNSVRKKHSLRLEQQGINEPQDIKPNSKPSIVMSLKLMFTLNQLV